MKSRLQKSTTKKSKKEYRTHLFTLSLQYRHKAVITWPVSLIDKTPELNLSIKQPTPPELKCLSINKNQKHLRQIKSIVLIMKCYVYEMIFEFKLYYVKWFLSLNYIMWNDFWVQTLLCEMIRKFFIILCKMIFEFKLYYVKWFLGSNFIMWNDS